LRCPSHPPTPVGCTAIITFIIGIVDRMAP
jgi:hypothetical protein